MRPKSKRPTKQRNYQRDTPRNEIHKVMSSQLSPELRERKGFRSLPLREGDTVKIMRGSMKGKNGKVTKISPIKQRVFVDKIFKRKTDNTEIPTPIHPSNLQIIKIVEKDRNRMELINRRTKIVEEKIDIEAALAGVEEDEVIDIDDTDLDEEFETDLDDDLELVEDEEASDASSDDTSSDDASSDDVSSDDEENDDEEEAE